MPLSSMPQKKVEVMSRAVRLEQRGGGAHDSVARRVFSKSGSSLEAVLDGDDRDAETAAQVATIIAQEMRATTDRTKGSRANQDAKIAG